MRSYDAFEAHLWDNIDFLYTSAEEEILHVSAKFLQPKVTADVFGFMADNCLQYWWDRWDYVDPDEEGYPTSKWHCRSVLEHTADSIYHYYLRMESQEHNALTNYPGTKMKLCRTCSQIHSVADRDEYPKKVRDKTNDICGACISNTYKYCQICNQFESKYEMVHVQRMHASVWVCYGCAAESLGKCANCRREGILADHEDVVVNDELTVRACPMCAPNMIRECEECEVEFPMINRIEHHNGEGEYCDRCIHTKIAYNSYVYKPSKIYFKTVSKERQNPATMFFGLELECELGDRIPRKTFAWKMKEMYTHEDLYIVHDGSLDYGIEVVLMPFSEAWYKENKTWLTQIYNRMFKLGGRFDEPKVGLHVHTSKAAWSANQIYKLMRFCYDPAHANVLERFYGRGSVHHACNDHDEYLSAVDIAKSGKNNNDTHHYNMINMSTGTTVEFRMFQGARDVMGVFAYLNYIRALFEFTLKTGLNGMTMKNFVMFVNEGNKYRIIQPYFTEGK
jgi:hypothetical protein